MGRLRPGCPRGEIDLELRGVLTLAAVSVSAAAGPHHEAVDVRILADDFRHAPRGRAHLVKRGALRGADVDVHRVVVLIGDEPFRHDVVHVHGHCEDGDEHHDHAEPVAEDDGEAPAVALEQRVERPVHQPGEALLAVHDAEKPAAQHRRQRDGDDARNQDGRGNGDRELAEQAPENPAHEQNRDEHHGQRRRHRENREPDLLRSLERRFERPLAVLDVSDDVLEHHDGVVDHEADREDERHHRQVVEAEPQHLHDRERAENRERKRQRRNERRRAVVQEQEDHRDDQEQRDEHRPLDVGERSADGPGPVAPDGHVDRRRQLRLEGGQQPADRIRHFDRVDAWLPLNLHVDRALAAVARIEPRRVHRVFDAVQHVGDLLEADGYALAVRHDDRLELIGVVQLPAGFDVERLARTVELAGRQIHVPVLQRLIDFVDPDLLSAQLVGIHLHAHGVLRRAPHAHLRDAVHHGDARSNHRLRIVVQDRHRNGVRHQAELHDALVGGILFAKRRRRRHAGRQERKHLGDRRLDVDGGAVHRAGEIELESHLTAAGSARGYHRIDPGDGRQLPLERTGNRRRHRGGIAARQSGLDLNCRKIDRRQIAHRQRLVSDDAEERNGGHQQAGGDGTLDEDLGEIH